MGVTGMADTPLRPVAVTLHFCFFPEKQSVFDIYITVKRGEDPEATALFTYKIFNESDSKVTQGVDVYSFH